MAKQNSRLTHALDTDLVLYALLGDLRAFDELVRRFRGAVLLTATQALGSRCGAEDVVQDAFLLAFKGLPQLADPSKFASWLHAITCHRARRVGTREGRSEPTEASRLDRLILAQSQELAPEPEEEALRNDRRDCLHAVLGQMPAEYRDVLHLRYFEEWPVARIAEYLSLPITTVKWRLHQGRERLRRSLTTRKEPETDGLE